MNRDMITYLPKFREWCIIYKSQATPTAQKNIYNINRYFRYEKKFDKDSFLNYLLLVRDEKEASTIEKYIASFKLFCEYLATMGIMNEWIKEIPMPKRDKKLPIILSVEEIEKILDTKVPRSYIHYKDQEEGKKIYDTIISICARCGARIGEVLKITPGELDFEQNTWRLDKTKTKRGRIIPIPTELIPILRKLSVDRPSDQPIFINQLTGRPIRIHQIENNFRLRLREAGINKAVNTHALRHSFITELMKLNISVFTVMALVGHENPKTTLEYNRLLFDSLVEGINRHPLNARKRNPYEILKDIKETIDRFQLKQDSRFMFNLEDGNEGLRISIFVR
jgi:integrase/recombinase XerD